MAHSIPGRGDMDNFYRYGAEQVSTPNDLNSEQPPVQNFALGGVATTDEEYQQQLQAYNDEMSRWQEQEYGPYKEQLAQSGQGFSPSMPLAMARGGEVDLAAVNASNLADEQEETINTNPVGTAQQMLANLTGSGQEQTSYEATPTKQTVKRVRATPSGSKGVKGMTLEYESLTKGDLGAMQDFKPKFKETDSARAQLEDLARQYQLKLAAVKNRSRGLAADTFGAPTLEGPTLTKSRLTRRRFAEGGEVESRPEDQKVTGVNRLVDFIAQKLPPEAFPTAGRTLLESVQGKKEPITEGSFSRDELEVLRRLTSKDKGSVSYEDYSRLAQQMRDEGQKNVDSTASLFSLGSPLGNVRNTLGRFTYARDPRGNVVIVDKYDFNPPDQSQTQEARTADYGVFGPYNLIREYAGQKLPPGKGRDVRINLGAPVKRAKGSSKEGEVAEPTEAELEAASRPAFVTPKSGIGRKQSITSGQANDAIVQGISEMPYNLAGAFVDIPTMLMRPFGYSNPTPFLGSEYLKQGATELGIRPEPPKEPAARALYELGQVGSSLVNPAAATRSVVRGAQRVGQAAGEAARDFQQYNQQLTVPSASYAVRPTGSVTSTKLIGGGSELGQIVDRGKREARAAVDAALANAPANTPTPSKTALEDRTALIQKFWDTKAKNYFERQFGTPDDPIADALKQGRIRGPLISEDLERGFPDFLLDALKEGKTRTRVGPTGVEETRFFPKYPEAHEEFTRRYDTGTGLRGMFFTNEPGLVSSKYSGTKSTLGTQRQQEVTQRTAETLGAQGVRPELANPKIDLVARSEVNPENVTGLGSSTSRKMLETLEPFMTSKSLDDMMSLDQLAAITAVRKGEPLYDVSVMSGPVADLLNTKSINRYLATLPDRELAKVRFEDVVVGANKFNERAQGFKALDKRIRAGKSVPEKVFEEGVSAPLLQIKEGPLEGFAFKRLEKSEATVPEGAYVGHSVGGYEMGGITYDAAKMKGFKAGDWRVYSLRDNRNRPVTTIEVKMVDENTPVVTQIKGNGRATGNVKPEKYDSAVLQFLKEHLKPAAIEERDDLLTPILQTYKDALGPSPRMK